MIRDTRRFLGAALLAVTFLAAAARASAEATPSEDASKPPPSTRLTNTMGGRSSWQWSDRKGRHNESAGPEAPDVARHLRTGRVIGRTMLATAGLAAMLLAAITWNRYRAENGKRRLPPSAQLKLLDSLTLAPRCYLQLVSANDQRFLVARDGNVVRCITPVGSFTDELDSLAPSEPDVAIEATTANANRTHDRDTDLNRLSTAGLSLEREKSSQRQLADFESTSRRNDRWQENLPART